MKILILTTSTDHHLFFVNKLLKKFKDIKVILETKKNYFSFKTDHNYQKKRKKFAKHFFIKNKKTKFKNENSIIETFDSNIFAQLEVKKIISLKSEIDKKIRWSKVKKLNNCNLFTIGDHSHRYISLTSVPLTEFKIEIDKSIKLFKKKIGINLKHYSYPEGQKKGFNISIKKYLKMRGIKICPASIPGFNNIKSDLFNLKRISINV